MGTWGPAPFENDAALNWLDALFDKFELVAYIQQTLDLDIAEYPEEIRAACSFVKALAKERLWPASELRPLLELSSHRLQEIFAAGLYENTAFAAELRYEIAHLQTLARGRPPSHREPGL
jgi:hypothetical protein